MCSSDKKDYKIEVEGTVLNVCEKCSSYGRIIDKVKQVATPKQKKKEAKLAMEAEADAKKTTETVQLIVPDYSELIRKAREKTGMTQKDFGKKINEKESMVHKLESSQMKPSIELARKLEKLLRIRLVEEIELESGKEKEDDGKPAGELTIGDLIKVKKR
jgi:putative transcription factor